MSRAISKPLTPRRAKTRERLIEAAADAILEKGFRDTTLDQIAAGAGMTKGAIYDNFESKEALFVAVMTARPSKLPLPASPDGSAADRLDSIARAVTADSEDSRLQIPLRAEFLLYSLAHPEMREMMRTWLTAGFAAERQAVERVFSADELAMSPEAFVVLLQAMVPGLMYLRSQAPDLINDKVVAEIFAGLAQKA